MGLLVTEINELRQMHEDFTNGVLSAEDLNARLNIYTQTEKRARLVITAWAVGVRLGITGMNTMISNEFIGSGKICEPKKLTSRTANRGH